MNTMIKLTGSSIIVGLALTTLGPLPAMATEIDRITVQDPANNNAVKFRVTSEGNVTGAALTVQQGATEAASAVKFAVTDATAIQNMVVTADGKIGLGTTTPTTQLELSSATNPKAKFGYTTDTGFGEVVFYEGSTYAGGLSVFGSNYASNPAWRNAFVISAAKPDTGKIIFRTKTTAGGYSERVTVDNGGNVGVGTSTPSQKLDVSGTVKATSFIGDGSQLTDLPASTAQVNSDWNASSGSAQILNKPSIATVATSGSYNDLSNKPIIPVETQPSIISKIATRTDGAVLAMQQGTGEAANIVKLAVKDSAGTATFNVTSDGKIGLGTTTPTTQLELSNATNPKAKFGYTTDAGYGEVVFYEGSTFAGGLSVFGSNYASNPAWRNAFVISAAKPDTGKIIFRTKTTAGGYFERMAIDNGGNVGIGTTSQTQKLEVAGGVRLNAPVSKPTCDASVRGTFWFTQGATDVKDTADVCAKDAANAYAWRVLY